MPRTYGFLRRRDQPFPAVRLTLALGLGAVFLVTALYVGTGQPADGIPLHTIRGADMDRCTNAPTVTGQQCQAVSFGRFNSLDPGDMVFVQRVHDIGDIKTAAFRGAQNYGAPGDVILFRPGGDPHASAIMHRALFRVIVGSDGTMIVPDLGISHAARLEQPEVLALTGCEISSQDWKQGEGYVTRGDNNAVADQCSGIALVHRDWILGKARGELPWVGLPLMLGEDVTGHSSRFSDAQNDSKAFLTSAIVLVVLAVSVSRWTRARRKRSRTAPIDLDG